MRNDFTHPCFNFECDSCGVQFEETMPLEWTDNGHIVLCPDCGGLTTKLLGSFPRHTSWSTWRLSLGNKD